MDSESVKINYTDLICPISKLIMMNPIMANDGHVYEQEQIEEWLKHGKISPLDHKTVLKPELFILSLSHKSIISAFLDKNPEKWSQVYYSKELEKEFIIYFKEGDYDRSQRILNRDKRILGKLNLNSLVFLVFELKLPLKCLSILFKFEKMKFIEIINENPSNFLKIFHNCYVNDGLDQLKDFTSEINLKECFLIELQKMEGCDVEIYEKLGVFNEIGSFSSEDKTKIELLKMRNKYENMMKQKNKEIEILKVKHSVKLKSSMEEKEKEIFKLKEMIKILKSKNMDDSVFRNSTVLIEKDSDIPVNSFGKDIPGRIETFSEDDIIPIKIQDNIKRIGFRCLKTVQSHVIRLIIQRRDTMICSGSNSGKTLAFLCPIVSRILNSKKVLRSSPIVLILTPTRILSSQMYKETLKLTFDTHITSFVTNGWVNLNDLVGVDILIGTPEKIIVLCKKKIISLSNVKYFVIDEGETMLSMEIMPTIEEICTYLPTNRQTILSSCYFPRLIRVAAREFIRDDFVFVAVKSLSYVKNQDEFKFVTNYAEKLDLLKQFLISRVRFGVGRKSSVAIFANKLSIQKVFNLASSLSKSLKLHLCCRIFSGDFNIVQQEESVDLFKIGKTNILICSPNISNGVDLGNLDFCINFDFPMPQNYERQTCKAKKSISFICKKELKLVEMIADMINLKSNSNLPKEVRNFLK